MERTLADLMRDGHDEEHVAQMVGQGVRRGVIDLANLAGRLGPLARRYGHVDGQSLVTHLLDVAGLSQYALARDLAKTSAGRELLATERRRLLQGTLAGKPQREDRISAPPDPLDAVQTVSLLSVAMATQASTSP